MTSDDLRQMYADMAEKDCDASLEALQHEVERRDAARKAEIEQNLQNAVNKYYENQKRIPNKAN